MGERFMTSIDTGTVTVGRTGTVIPRRVRQQGRARPASIEFVRAAMRGGVHAATSVVTLAGQVGLLGAIFAVSNVVVTRLHLRVPANIVGMLLLFALLCTGTVKEQWVSPAAGVLTRHLAFFFIPIAVGLMDCGGRLWPVAHWLLLAIVVSSVVGMAVSGGLIQLFGPRGRGEIQ
jgi:holin-like protein